MRASSTAKNSAYRWGAAMLFLALGTILAALGFEYIGGYQPCPLCLQQRWAYYAGIPLLFAGLVLLSAQRSRAASLLVLVVALIFLANFGLAVYHAGAEWKFWPGPETCAESLAPLAPSPGEIPLQGAIRCDEAQWRFLGLSFAGWNALISLLLAFGTASSALSISEPLDE